MIDIFKIKEKFIVKDKNYKTKLLSYDILYEYVGILRSEFYNEYLDFKFYEEFTDSVLADIMLSRVNHYENNTEGTNEFRFVITDSNERIIAGYTLYRDLNEIELAYFVLPEFQGKGVAKNMIADIISKLQSIVCKGTILKVNIQSKNTKSIKLVEKCGFKKRKRYRGRFGYNIEFVKVLGE
jgi:RimJ/RimL family protein N-acetyltransferase